MRWTLFVDTPRPGWENMAVDCALLDLAGAYDTGFLRLYGWEPHCLSFGRHEPALRRYDRERIRALGIDCVRRPTGGRAVWHARELTYAVAAPLAAFGGLREAYCRIHQLLAAALRKLGASPTLAARQNGAPGPAAGPCFAAPVGGEVLIAGRKVVGSAQLRQGDAFLQHGSLLLSDDQSLARELAGAQETVPSEVTLSAALGAEVSLATAADAVSEAAVEALGAQASSGVPLDVGAAALLHVERFRSREWTWQR